MLLGRTEREQRVIDLYQQSKTIREIAQEVHMSFADIGAIIRKVTRSQGDDDGKSKEQDKASIVSLSKDSQAFKLFSLGFLKALLNLRLHSHVHSICSYDCSSFSFI
jgi:hypothetical protein